MESSDTFVAECFPPDVSESDLETAGPTGACVTHELGRRRDDQAW